MTFGISKRLRKISKRPVLFLIIFWMVLFGLIHSASAGEHHSFTSICFKETCFFIENADTPASRRLGLMGRTTLAENHGMLLVFENSARHAIWMKNMHIPLDLFWLDKNLEIVDIREFVQPCKADPCPSYIPVNPAKYVLEAPAGTAKRYQIEPSMAFAAGPLNA